MSPGRQGAGKTGELLCLGDSGLEFVAVRGANGFAKVNLEMDGNGTVALNFTAANPPFMDIRFECEKCGQQLVIVKVGAGLSIQCPTCSADLIAPEAMNPAEQPALSSSEPVSDESIQIREDGSWAVSAPPPRLPNLTEQVQYEIRDELVEIRQLDFFGPFSRSPNGRYLLAWSDHDGLYILLEGNKVIAKGKMQAPNDGKVADNGNFIFNDWSGSGEKLSGTFYAFAANGEILISKHFRANLDTNNLSDDGRFAFCDTLRSDCKADSDKTFIFDLEARASLSDEEYDKLVEQLNLGDKRSAGERLAAEVDCLERELQKTQHVVKGRDLHEQLMDLYSAANAPQKVAEHRKALIELEENDLRNRGYSEFQRSIMHQRLADLYQGSGDKLKAKEHKDAWLRAADGIQLFDSAQIQLSELKVPNLKTYAESITLLKLALERGVSSNYQARIQRALGEVYHNCGEGTKAIEHLEAALRLNPKIGVQKVLKQLKSEKEKGHH